MRVGTVSSSELRAPGLRLNGGFFLSEDEQATRTLRGWKGAATTVADACKSGGVFSGPIFKKIDAAGPTHGRPYVSAKDLFRAEVLPAGYISRLHGDLLDDLELSDGMIVVTCSGMNLGKALWVRRDFSGMCGSGDLIRLRPDSKQIRPGYLFAFLRSRFGRVSIRRHIFGGHIKHVSPGDVADIRVPRLSEEEERRIHDQVVKAAALRSSAVERLASARAQVMGLLGEPGASSPSLCSTVSSRELMRTRRLEGFYYNATAVGLDSWISDHPAGFRELGDVADVFDVPPFKHIYVGPDHGVPFYTSGELFKLSRLPTKFLSRTRTRGLHKYVIEEGWVLLARSGQLGGIIGRPQFADSSLHESTTSDHVIRIVPKADVPGGFLWAYLSTAGIGYPLITRTMTGASVPALWPTYLMRIPVLNAPPKAMAEVDALVRSAFDDRARATLLEQQAVGSIEAAIEEAS